MYSIMDAVEAAQRRSEERDRLNQQRSPLIPVLQTQPTAEPIKYDFGGDDGGGGVKDTRTEHQKYQDAIDANQWISAVPVIGPVLGMMNDSFIEKYEANNPDRVVGGPNKFSTVGRAQGKGLTVEEQLQAKAAGLGLGKALGFGDQAGQPGYSLLDRVFGTTPMNIAKEADYIGVFPQDDDDGGRDDGSIGGYKQSSLSWESPAPEDKYGYA
jgi:hypothetical protein